MKHYARYASDSGHIIGEMMAEDFGVPLPTRGEGVIELAAFGASAGKYVGPNGEGLLDREHFFLPAALTVETGVEFQVDLPADGWFTFNGETPQQAAGTTSFTLPNAGTFTLTLLGRYSGQTVITATDLAAARNARWESLKAVRADRLAVAAIPPFGTFDSDEVGKANITGQVTALMVLGDQAPAEITWKMHDNTMAVFTPQQFIQASLLVSQHVSDTYAASWQLEQQLNAASSLAEIEAVQWPSE